MNSAFHFWYFKLHFWNNGIEANIFTLNFVLKFLPFGMESFVIVFLYISHDTIRELNFQIYQSSENVNLFNSVLSQHDQLFQTIKNIKELLNFIILKILYAFIAIVHLIFYLYCLLPTFSKNPLLFIHWLYVQVFCIGSNFLYTFIIVYLCEKIIHQVRAVFSFIIILYIKFTL